MLELEKNQKRMKQFEEDSSAMNFINWEFFPSHQTNQET